jgi:hypothetical protein
MENHIKSFTQYFDPLQESVEKINEAGWDSIDEDAGEIVVNGVVLEIVSVCVYDTPNTIAYEVLVQPTAEELTKIGIWSDKYMDEVDARIYIYSNGKNLTKKELKSFGAETVRDIEDENVVEYFYKDYLAKVHNEDMTTEQFMEIIKSYDINEYDDFRFISKEEAPGYKFLGKVGIFDK